MAGDIAVSVIIMTRNEAANIADCLGGLSRFAQVVVVDSHSDDATPALAMAAGATLVPFRWNGQYPKKKQWSLRWPGLNHDWVLFVDADERLSPCLIDEIAERVQSASPDQSAFFIDSRPVWLGRTLRWGIPYRKIALLRRSRARFPVCNDLSITTMWEVEGHYQPVITGTVGRLRHKMTHGDNKPPYAWFERHNRYSDWEAALAHFHADDVRFVGERGIRRIAKQVVARLPCRPLLAFVQCYLLYLGFLDGWPGLHHAAARSFYYWQISLKRAWLDLHHQTSQANPEAPCDPWPVQPALALSAASPANVLTSSKVRRRTDSSGIL